MLDRLPTLQELEKDINAIASIDGVYLVADVQVATRSSAETSTFKSAVGKIAYHLSDEIKTLVSQNIFGFVLVIPYNGWLGGKRSCYNHTAKIIATTLGEETLGAKLDRVIRAALVDNALAMMTSSNTRFRSIMTAMAYKDDQPAMKDKLDLWLERGFERSGTLRDVIEKNGLLLDEVFLQRTLKCTDEGPSEKAAG